MRTIKTHQTNPANKAITIEADDPTHGGASHNYRAAFPGCPDQFLIFQNGPVNEDGNGVNGLTHEVLIAIVIDRLQQFQDGPYKCRENALAITKLEEAFHWLEHRTRARERRGVEGTHQV